LSWLRTLDADLSVINKLMASLARELAKPDVFLIGSQWLA
jgi:hypothetical protein|tara:strand:- start:382 stop:501 length:120 start_codon:yes stop_codon:yes gene_type:complete